MLNVDVVGEGPDLVVLHGWALHCGLFDGVADALAQRYRVHFIDLPGHGHNAGEELPLDVDAVASVVLEAAPEHAHWLGWSLGGMVTMAAAMIEPQRVDRVVTVATTPKFVATQDWPHAIPEETLNSMAQELLVDFRATVKGFLSLQVMGDERARTMLRELRQKAYAHGEPKAQSLANGLQILHDTDLRERLAGISAPLLAIMGSRDRLAPPKAGAALADAVQDGKCITVNKAAHAPFISHRDEFLDAVIEFFS